MACAANSKVIIYAPAETTQRPRLPQADQKFEGRESLTFDSKGIARSPVPAGTMTARKLQKRSDVEGT
ncbi:hypothetical protein M404DRAFT_923472 [Pisolithus tinctorius Marx 270]|uniref:Uncharacterized protein n=1 Tax=Pisolithus tinctorius Marx 270 TaxID=870435 RepID=A0A0C3NMU0_PISTI|nr:hypothetical protein M404DRAFT_923472 [Pisolithus tinctorius Marx 270]